MAVQIAHVTVIVPPAAMVPLGATLGSGVLVIINIRCTEFLPTMHIGRTSVGQTVACKDNVCFNF